ncbi:relaxase/mobilization nuclease domain-containing protein [Mucilaginibacter kameinonensis]|uniref:relaxase/mobilization nuclease domain-containing protein n=1 Tax=Mucilaginibacter kameinonensis TaxID=452286 RepID=UPI000EF84BB7|nr:relaxase/mobilization nuclease domain-containing protein [Mucilaginibacter kameinonensis]
MTADQVKGKGFRGALNYNFEKVSKGKAELLDMSFAELKAQTIIDEVRMVRLQRPNLAKYFYHTSLNFPVNEDLDNKQMKVIAHDYLDAMGFKGNQYMIFRHYDADHPHLHLLVNRIGYDGSLVSDSNDYQRSEAVLRKLEKEYGLTPVISSKQAQERAMTKNELEMMKRTDAPSTKMKLQVILKEVLRQRPTTAEFIQALEAKGINVRFNQANTGLISGISYGIEGMQFKGQHLGNAYKWSSVKNSIGYEQERDRAAVHEANIRTGAGQTTGTSINIGGGTRPPDITKGNRKVQKTASEPGVIKPQSTGQLQETIGKANSGDRLQVQGTGYFNQKHRIPDQNDDISRRTDQARQQQGWQQVAAAGLPDRSLISDLLGTDNPDGGMADMALTGLRKKRKKKRRLSL